MKVANLSVSLACALLLAPAVSAEDRVSGPYTHENLSIFLIHGAAGGKTYLTLKDAVEQKKVVVSETKKVNELAVENVSNEAVYIQGGDIVKGGQQDRVISNDFVLPSKSGKVPVSAFCVEQGRWSQRGGEKVSLFESSKLMVSTKELKMAVKFGKDQSAVWREVANTQAALKASAPASPTSLQLTLESRAVADAVDGYLKALTGIIAAKPDTLGFAFAVNGTVNSADIYSSPALFTAMWPKLLRSSAVEAVGHLKKDNRFQPATSEAIDAFLHAAEKGKQSAVDVDRRVKLVTYAGDDEFLFESREGAGWIHRNYIKK
jgi:hypothetical protein